MGQHTLGCFGKLPIHTDFIKYQASCPEVRSLDRWFQEGIYFAKSRMGSLWNETFSAAEPWNFLYHTGLGDTFLLGVYMPSQDKGGRAYPFILFLRIDKKAFGGPSPFVPLCFSQFLKKARDIVQTGWLDMDFRTFLSKLEDMTIPNPKDFSLVQQFYLEKLQDWKNREFWADLFGDFRHPRKYEMDRNLIDLLHPLQGFSSNKFKLGLKFPLLSAKLLKNGEEGCDIPFWFEFVFHSLKQESDPLFFWNRNNIKGMPSMMAFFSTPSPKNFFSLIRPDLTHDAWFNLVSEGRNDPEKVCEIIQDDRKKLLDNEALSMAAFLNSK